MIESLLHVFSTPEAWIALLTLTALELILGIDNIIFISILVDKLPPHQREKARRLGLFMAMFMRIGLLLTLSWIIGLKEPLFHVLNYPITGRGLILILGGLFLVYKSVGEIHQLTEGEEGSASKAVAANFVAVILQIMMIDIIFSLDSIITAVGMVNQVPVMILAVILSVGLMMLFARPIGEFISRHPSIKMLALSFLIVVGVVLIADGFGNHVPKGYIYFAMVFSLAVETLNIRMRKGSSKPVDLREKYATDEDIKNG
jgi:predicted tellurium resistance membrane protein TerC